MIKLALEAGKATPAPPVGPALGSKGVNIMAFCKDYNARTADKAGYVIPVEITVYDVSFFAFLVDILCISLCFEDCLCMRRFAVLHLLLARCLPWALLGDSFSLIPRQTFQSMFNLVSYDGLCDCELSLTFTNYILLIANSSVYPFQFALSLGMDCLILCQISGKLRALACHEDFPFCFNCRCFCLYIYKPFLYAFVNCHFVILPLGSEYPPLLSLFLLPLMACFQLFLPPICQL